MSKDIALEVKNVQKSFRLPTEQSSGIKQAFINRMKGIKGYTKQEVLKDISFTIEKGDFFGIVGRNGSGKSTLLKLISGIYEPDKGEIKVNGSLVPFIELGVGFNPELTGRENVYLNGALLGFSTIEIDAMYDEIVDFAELHDFMDQKLKNYSSGMQVRLAFSVAIRAESDILVLDEVLAVGDEAFQRKCFTYFAELKRDKKTVVLVTHSMDSVQQFCNKAMLIKNGKALDMGNTARVAQLYRAENNKEEGITVDAKKKSNKNFKIIPTVKTNKRKLFFMIKIFAKQEISDPVITFVINRDNGEMVYRWVSDEKIMQKINLNYPQTLCIELENIFPNGIFNVQIAIKSRDRSVEYAVYDDVIKFDIVNEGSYANDMFWKPKESYKIERIP
jgi:ABC-2 type transport system ATP-binding protein